MWLIPGDEGGGRLQFGVEMVEPENDKNYGENAEENDDNGEYDCEND